MEASSWLPVVLSTTAGAVDVIGFLTLGGLFAAHITGNLVVSAPHYVTGRFSQVGPLLSVPVFIAVLGAVVLLFGRFQLMTRSGRALLLLHAALLAACLGLRTLVRALRQCRQHNGGAGGHARSRSYGYPERAGEACHGENALDGGYDHKHHATAHRYGHSCTKRRRIR